MNKEQRKFLLKVKEAGLLNRSDVLPDEIKILRFLMNSGYITQTGESGIISYKISESGKSKIQNTKTENFRFRLPMIISIVALAISALHILLEILGIV